MTFEEVNARIKRLNAQIRQRNDFLAATRAADHLPDGDLDTLYDTLKAEIKRRNDVDSEICDHLYEYRDRLEEIA